ncbi:alpha-L-arabinofuranosidase C-terminal domain-containing protein [Hymenobacter edaphi]|uniref:non-reducing end alpha-L-arabinofuranosidase n=1 Tax=Hymenobacter edaphi TaxID=2211146 RepID=A0A328BAK2_9BACT|nr:alpha-L-arabinofuranosidase C-terminal domain-containing protein [Hymenobacter edaphi]RAK62068.1 alpha-L-arabinofuranosidase [Hymenobacter edaphi]
MRAKFCVLCCGLTASVFPSHAQSVAPAVITVRADQPGAAVPKTMFGLFFEDINFAADGGLYPELVKNKSFELPEPLLGWRALRGGAALEAYQVRTDGPANPASPHYLRLAARTASPDAGVINDGFRGMGVKQGEEYTLTLLARRPAGDVRRLRVTLEGDKGAPLAEAALPLPAGAEWQPLTLTLRPAATFAKARLRLVLDGAGTVDLDAVSLYPKTTWIGRPNGLRPDLVQLLKDLKPGFLRFPGGCIVEGRTLSNRYQWKQTIGEVASRQPMINRWNTEFAHRFTPDYYQSFGLGFFEYFQLSEDIGAEPLPILNVGMACQYNSAELAPLGAAGPSAPAGHDHAQDDPTLDTFIQDALDLLEFANGPATSPWGARRVAMGHPAPFNLKYLGVGNEQWGPQYLERYEPFAKAVKAKYPRVQLVSSAGPSPDGASFDLATKRLREMPAGLVDLIDEHYYARPEWFREHAGRYDNYPRTGPKIFAGEYAAHPQGVGNAKNRNTWDAALSEAAFMTGLERNADVVQMASYAPLFAHVDAWQWAPDLIWFDNLQAYGTPSYYVQQLFSLHKGTRVLPVQLPAGAKNGQDGLYVSAVADGNDVVVKLVNYAATPRPVQLDLNGLKRPAKTGQAQVLAAADLQTENSLQEPRKLAPAVQSFALKEGRASYRLAPYSLTVLRVASQKH